MIQSDSHVHAVRPHDAAGPPLHTVFVVEGDEQACLDVKAAVTTVNLKCFRTGGDFLRFYHRDLVGCLIVNVSLPDMSGMELQDRLLAQYCTLPLIFLGTEGSVAQAVHVMRKGAMDFLARPFQPQDLMNAVDAALELVDSSLSSQTELSEFAARFEQLSPREREVQYAVVSGKSNRVIAADLGVSEKTVETHRLRLMHKMQAKSVAELVRMALRLEEFRDGKIFPDALRRA